MSLSLFAKYSSGQGLAGSIPPGSSVLKQAVSLSIEGYQVDTMAYLDIDCDGLNDIGFKIYQGYPPGNEDNLAYLSIFNNAFSICTTDSTGIVSLYNLDDTLCITGHQWTSDSLYVLGCYGYNCTEPVWNENEKYIAYKKNTTQAIGWIKLSIHLFSEKAPQPITLIIHEWLLLCIPNALVDIRNDPSLVIYPNPTKDGWVHIQHPELINHINVITSLGKIAKSYSGQETQILLPDNKGLYIIQVISTQDQTSYKKVLRL